MSRYLRTLDDNGQWIYYCNTCGDDALDDQCRGAIA